MKRYVKSSSTGSRSLAEVLSGSRFTEVKLRDMSGKILGTFSTDDAIQKYGECEVTGAYSESKTCVSIWIIS